jgi:O-antigen/teichoic acid export membrane protein
MALNGYEFGLSLSQVLVGSVASSAICGLYGSWIPSFVFSKKIIPHLFGFGSKLLVASLYAQTLNNVYNICIGRYYPTASLGYYTRTFADVSAGTIVAVFNCFQFLV